MGYRNIGEDALSLNSFIHDSTTPLLHYPFIAMTIHSSSTKIDLKDLSPAELREFVASYGKEKISHLATLESGFTRSGFPLSTR